MMAAAYVKCSPVCLETARNWFDRIYHRLHRWRWIKATRQVAWSKLVSLCPVKNVFVEGPDGIKRLIRLDSLAEVTSAVGRKAEDDVAAIVAALPNGGTFVDLGANVGRYVLMASKAVGDRGRVYAFEPVPEIFRSLTRNAELNAVANVTFINAAVSNMNGEAEMSLGSSIGWSTLQAEWLWSVGREEPRLTTRVRTLDLEDFFAAYSIATADLVKIDVEGHELTILQSLRHILNPCVVKSWIVEVHRPIVEPEDIASIFIKAGYRVRQTGEFVYAS